MHIPPHRHIIKNKKLIIFKKKKKRDGPKPWGFSHLCQLTICMASLESFTATTADSVPLHSKSRRGMTDSPLGQRPLSQQLAQAPPFHSAGSGPGILSMPKTPALASSYLWFSATSHFCKCLPSVRTLYQKIPFAASLTLMPLSSLQETVHPYLTKQSFYPLNPFQVKGAENPVLKVCAVAAVKEKGRREGALMRESGHEARHLESARLFQRKIIPFATFSLFLERDAKRCKKQV